MINGSLQTLRFKLLCYFYVYYLRILTALHWNVYMYKCVCMCVIIYIYTFTGRNKR